MNEFVYKIIVSISIVSIFVATKGVISKIKVHEYQISELEKSDEC